MFIFCDWTWIKIISLNVDHDGHVSHLISGVTFLFRLVGREIPAKVLRCEPSFRGESLVSGRTYSNFQR